VGAEPGRSRGAGVRCASGCGVRAQVVVVFDAHIEVAAVFCCDHAHAAVKRGHRRGWAARTVPLSPAPAVRRRGA
jgi:hypothetical protein